MKVVYLATKWALMEKTCLWWFGNNKGADQPAHPRSLISTFVIGLLESIISRPYLDLLREKFQFSSNKVAVTEHAGLNLT